MSTTQLHPRRRAAAPSQVTKDLTSSLSLKPTCLSPSQLRDKGASLRKGATFHTSAAPASPAEDPILNVRTLPVRSPTSPKALEDLVAASEKRVAEIIESFDRSFSGLTSSADDDVSDTEVLPVPSFLLAHAAVSSDLMDIGDKKKTTSKRAHTTVAAAAAKNNKASKAGATNTGEQAQKLAASTSDDENDDNNSIDEHRHASDSGLGSSIASTNDDHANPTASSYPGIAHSPSSSASSTTSVYSSLTATAIRKSLSELKVSAEGHVLSAYATKKIKTHIVNPILQEPDLEEYHSLVKELPQRIEQRAITCLRDLEKTLVFLAPVSADFSDGEGVLTHCFLRAKTKANSPASYLNFCEFSIQCIHTTVDHLNELDQRRPSDRPYTNTYFVDLVEQVRQYARIMAISRQKKANGEKLNAMDYTPWVSHCDFDSFFDKLLTCYSGEKLRLRGGLSEDGKPAELVREKKDGKVIPIDAGHVDISMGDTDEEDLLIDEDVRRSMARKRKCDQGKEEYRACRECGKLFTRPCDLTKHEKTHSRPWKCPETNCKYHELGWPTEKERDRHVNDKHSDAPALFRCLYKPCAYTSKRESNCKQHMEKAHGWQYVRSKSKKGQSLVATQISPPTPLMPTPTSGTAFPNLSTPASPFGNSPATSTYQEFSDAVATPSVDGSMSGMSTHSNLMMPGVSVPSPASYVGVPADARSGVNFQGFGAGIAANEMSYSPLLSEGRHDSLATPGLSIASNESAAPQPTFEEQFNFADLAANNPWPSMAEWFHSYSIPQQPTPAWSDENFDEQNFDLKPSNFHNIHALGGNNANLPLEFSPHAQGDFMLTQAGESQLEEIKSFNHDSSLNTHTDDFTLYGAEVGESSAAGAAMFPDLGNVGGQFGVGADPMFDGMTDGDAMEQYTNISSMCPPATSSQNYHN